MKDNKVNATIRINKELWELSRIMLPCSRNAFIEKQLRNYINSLDDLDKLEREIKEDTIQIEAKKERLQHLKEMRELNNKNEKVISEAMSVVFDIIGNNGAIAKTQIAYIASHNHISEDVLTNEIKKRNLTITNYRKHE